MADTSILIVEPLLQQAVPRSIRGGGKVSAMLALLGGFGLAFVLCLVPKAITAEAQVLPVPQHMISMAYQGINLPKTARASLGVRAPVQKPFQPMQSATSGVTIPSHLSPAAARHSMMTAASKADGEEETGPIKLPKLPGNFPSLDDLPDVPPAGFPGVDPNAPQSPLDKAVNAFFLPSTLFNTVTGKVREVFGVTASTISSNIVLLQLLLLLAAGLVLAIKLTQRW